MGQVEGRGWQISALCGVRRMPIANAIAALAATSPDEKCGILVTDIRPKPVECMIKYY